LGGVGGVGCGGGGVGGGAGGTIKLFGSVVNATDIGVMVGVGAGGIEGDGPNGISGQDGRFIIGSNTAANTGIW